MSRLNFDRFSGSDEHNMPSAAEEELLSELEEEFEKALRSALEQSRAANSRSDDVIVSVQADVCMDLFSQFMGRVEKLRGDELARGEH